MEARAAVAWPAVLCLDPVFARLSLVQESLSKGDLEKSYNSFSLKNEQIQNIFFPGFVDIMQWLPGSCFR